MISTVCQCSCDVQLDIWGRCTSVCSVGHVLTQRLHCEVGCRFNGKAWIKLQERLSIETQQVTCSIFMWLGEQMGWNELGGQLCLWQRGHSLTTSQLSLSFISVPIVTSLLHHIHLRQPRSDLTRNPLLSPSIWISAIVFNQFHHHQCLDSIRGVSYTTHGFITPLSMYSSLWSYPLTEVT